MPTNYKYKENGCSRYHCRPIFLLDVFQTRTAFFLCLSARYTNLRLSKPKWNLISKQNLYFNIEYRGFLNILFYHTPQWRMSSPSTTLACWIAPASSCACSCSVCWPSTPSTTSLGPPWSRASGAGGPIITQGRCRASPRKVRQYYLQTYTVKSLYDIQHEFQ